eukprot:TRINITY_DN34319_c0_g1_i1.p1 TRINITY_DN34319_c0_g1~~TRINITY_DN34319_c0_g1_i1.p1  ORF type:complete len:517 (+),score=144.86 TRINITY_DN34319_c0_g1_i1:20-1570(+)
MAEVADPSNEEPPAKRPRPEESRSSGSSCSAPRSAENGEHDRCADAPGAVKPNLTAEQKARAEQNRLAALERKKQRAAAEAGVAALPGERRNTDSVVAEATSSSRAKLAASAAEPLAADAAASGSLSQEQLERIQRNRQAALERKQRQQQAESSTGCVPDSAQHIQEGTSAASSSPATQQPSQAGAGISEGPSVETADSEQPASPPSPELSDLCSCSVSCSSSDASSSSTSCSDKEAQEEESSSSSSSSSCSESSEDVAEDDAIADDDNEDEEDLGGAELQDDQDDQEMEEAEAPPKEDQAEEDAEGAEEDLDLKNLPRVRGDVRPKNEPPCCTTRWPPLTLSPVVTGDFLPPRKKEERTAKQALVAQLLCRWWYVLPDWPPKDFDYDAALAARGYRRVSVEAFEHEPELDEQGRKKAFAISGGYLGLFRDDQGNLVDVRPVEGRPSYDQLIRRSQLELHKLVLAAYMRQLEDAESRPCTGAVSLEHRKELRKEVAQAKQRAVFAMTFMSKGSSTS